MIRVIVTTDAELADAAARHDFAPLFSHPYKVFRQRPSGQLELIGGNPGRQVPPAPPAKPKRRRK